MSLSSPVEPRILLTLTIVQKALRLAWNAYTSGEPELWNKQNRALGQAAVTACVVQDLCGGEVLWAVVQFADGTQKEHFYNRLQSGAIIDFTRQQYPTGTVFSEGQARKKNFKTVRAYALSLPEMQGKIATLTARIELAKTRNVA